MTESASAGGPLQGSTLVRRGRLRYIWFSHFLSVSILVACSTTNPSCDKEGARRLRSRSSRPSAYAPQRYRRGGRCRAPHRRQSKCVAPDRRELSILARTRVEHFDPPLLPDHRHQPLFSRIRTRDSRSSRRSCMRRPASCPAPATSMRRSTSIRISSAI